MHKRDESSIHISQKAKHVIKKPSSVTTYIRICINNREPNFKPLKSIGKYNIYTM